ncbi:MAG: hypothetical protein A3G33_03410 [Omnitrophica bacterium RIFCSPLOWO2_12_FULL_44_17]|uniref:Prepilin-type N-terminal cleavage/methylation domain-containing protein n=1 Tax=Candidatus Danuiimicrobium aquiferis TaxID=1801832 RepID=A0A1G1KU36_9BACT|nr:MAG: hypothetical protein A3B72_06955 [Omnitrophica bacterium RIFCSPHIGHO2_02_FULL_45_28]OGW90177.1 MAG: hypothetical protein A3E74_06365 [Omnitrophica bacterium RIFCSPHIGHO2_12_FULL_44_12]OGW96365.1 MAG: hypothetical protein A3G33_03410 [Omnitrophica bacterium RIFCSPLOWO2_12_FULL_44_17]OGX04826.1 MAG: hypothetical protein A3J12_07720 [Omnitrophica bacterium RIFCSPLOWO2_02_FULL_44_11]
MKYFLNGTNQKLRRTNLFSPRSFHFARISHSGFSLTELLITVTVLGILAAVSVPVYLNHLEKARISEAIQLLNRVHIGKQQFAAIRGATATTWAQVGMATPTPVPPCWSYATQNIPGIGIVFRATLNNSQSKYNGNNIILCRTGKFCGTHPLIPGSLCVNSSCSDCTGC